nr:MAG TPA: hypothetical protein [Caudoviricetes sp.]
MHEIWLLNIVIYILHQLESLFHLCFHLIMDRIIGALCIIMQLVRLSSLNEFILESKNNVPIRMK